MGKRKYIPGVTLLLNDNADHICPYCQSAYTIVEVEEFSEGEHHEVECYCDACEGTFIRHYTYSKTVCETLPKNKRQKKCNLK